MSDASENIALKEKKPTSDSSLDGVDNQACDMDDEDSQRGDRDNEVVKHGTDVESKIVENVPEEVEDGIANKSCDMATQTTEIESAGNAPCLQ